MPTTENNPVTVAKLMGAQASPELLERDAEIGSLGSLLARARAGSGASVVIEGEAGVGKTALLEYLCGAADEAGMTVLRARGGELEREFTWGVVRQWFEPWWAGLGARRHSELLAGSARLAEPLFGAGSGAAAPDGLFPTLHGLYWLTVNAARDTPVVLAVDDLHWSDAPSLRFAAHLVPRLDGLPILLAATTRPPGSESTPAVGLLRHLTVDPAAHQLRPSPLSADASSRLIAARLDVAADPEFCSACHEMSHGNPFLLSALLDAWQAEHAHATAQDAERIRQMRPGAVTRHVLVRLATMPEGSQALAEAIAVLGARAEFGQARRLALLDTETAAAAAAALSRAGIVRGESTLEFVHPLVRGAVLGDLAAAEQARWHARAAQVKSVDGAPVTELAPHLLASLPDGDQGTVADLRSAAMLARAQGAPDLAVRYLARALREPPDAASRADVLFELGAAEVVRDPEGGIAHLREALERADDGARRAEIALTLGDALAVLGRLAEGITVLEGGLAELHGETSELQARLEAALIAAARWERSAQALRHQTVERLRVRADADERLDPLLGAQLALEIAATGRQRELAVHHARRVLESAPELMVAPSTVPEVGLVLAFAGFPLEAWQAIQTFLESAQRSGWLSAVATSSTCASLAALHLGWISEAVASARGPIPPGSEALFGPISLAFLIEALIERGETELAEHELSSNGAAGELAPIWPTTPLLLARGRLRGAIGDHARALEDLRAVGERVTAFGLSNVAMTPWRSSASVSLAAIGDRREAVALASEELELARGWGAARGVGIALRALGLAHDDAHGIELLTEAAGTLADASAPVEHARGLYELGAAQRRRGARAQARDHLRHALDIAHRHGALALAQQARAELVVAGARPRRDALSGRDALTSSELRVARLAAEGRTNTEIAQLLFVTPRTVESHLTSSYSKLGIRTRRDLAGALPAQP